MKKPTKKEQLEAAVREIALTPGWESEAVRKMIAYGKTQTILKKTPGNWARTCFRIAADARIIGPYLRREERPESLLHYASGLEYLIEDFADRWNYNHCPGELLHAYETKLSPSTRKRLRERFRELNPETAEADDLFKAYMAMPSGLRYAEQLKADLLAKTYGGDLGIVMLLPTFQWYVTEKTHNRILFMVNRNGEMVIHDTRGMG